MKRIIILLTVLIVSASLSAWELVQDKDSFGDPIKDSYHIELNCVRISAGSTPESVAVSFETRRFGFYQSDYFMVRLKEEDGTLHDYGMRKTYTFKEKEALEMLAIFRRNHEVKIYLWWDYGHGDSVNGVLSKTDEGLDDMLKTLYEAAQKREVSDAEH